MSPGCSNYLVNRKIWCELHTEYGELVDLLILLREEVDRFEGSILVYSIDVTKEGNSRRAGDRSGHGAAEEKMR